MSYNLLCILAISSIFLLVVKSWNRQHHGQTIHPTEKLISMNLFKILCVKNVIASAHFGTLTQRSVHPTVSVLLTKRNKK